MVLLPALPARAATTTVTFTLTPGTLAITVPASASFGSFPVTIDNIVSDLGTVTVLDNRGAAGATWSATVSSTAFVGSGAATGTSILASRVAYDPGAITATNVTATGTALAALSSTPTATVAGSAGVGINTASWIPQLTIDIPSSGAVAGVYTATVTHSVA